MRMGDESAVAIGASLGGLEVLKVVVPALPADLDAIVLIALHIPPTGRTFLADALGHWSRLPVRRAVDGEPAVAGTVYVAQPDYHLTVSAGRIRLLHTASVNRHRPSIDVLFRSVAKEYGARSVAVTLSGLSDDGALGAAAVERAGGTVIVQDPEEALAAELPSSTLRATERAIQAAAAEIGMHVAAQVLNRRLRPATEQPSELPEPGETTAPAGFSCPSCGGVLTQIHENGDPPAAFYCHVGHQFSERGLADAQHEAVEDALWAAVRALNEQATMCGRLARSTQESVLRRRLQQRERESLDRAAVLRELLLQALS